MLERADSAQAQIAQLLGQHPRQRRRDGGRHPGRGRPARPRARGDPPRPGRRAHGPPGPVRGPAAGAARRPPPPPEPEPTYAEPEPEPRAGARAAARALRRSASRRSRRTPPRSRTSPHTRPRSRRSRRTRPRSPRRSRSSSRATSCAPTEEHIPPPAPEREPFQPEAEPEPAPRRAGGVRWRQRLGGSAPDRAQHGAERHSARGDGGLPPGELRPPGPGRAARRGLLPRRRLARAARGAQQPRL